MCVNIDSHKIVNLRYVYVIHVERKMSSFFTKVLKNISIFFNFHACKNIPNLNVLMDFWDLFFIHLNKYTIFTYNFRFLGNFFKF
jgi:hypothetical protein